MKIISSNKKIFMTCFLIGIIFSISCTLLAEWDWYQPESKLLTVLLYPGISTGHLSYKYLFQNIINFDSAVNISMCVGIGTMGFFLGTIGIIVKMLLSRFQK